MNPRMRPELQQLDRIADPGRFVSHPLRQNRLDLPARHLRLRPVFGVKDPLDQIRSEQQRHSFFRRKTDRREKIALHQGVSPTRSPDQRHPRFAQGLNVPVDRPHAGLENSRQVLGPRNLSSLQLHQNREHPVRFIHGRAPLSSIN
ncbi:hypothetical protein D1872_228260 [compost metagenome]